MTAISPRDKMFNGNVDHYEWVGRSAVSSIRRSLRAAGKGEVGSILDLPSGYGRVIRRLRVAFPDARLTACDVDRGRRSVRSTLRRSGAPTPPRTYA